jgi:transcriptional regulator of arginine metabolism
MTKTYRQGQILKLVRGKGIKTQEELAQELKSQGIAATQVTLSRDIRDLRLVKTREGYKEIADEEPGVPPRRAARAEPGGAQNLARPRQFGRRRAR